MYSFTTAGELLLENVNIVCANKNERQEKKQLGQQKSSNIHVGQSSPM